MALEHLLSALERDAEAEAQGLMDEAGRETARIAAESRARLDRRRAEFAAGHEAVLGAAAAGAVAAARRLARRQVLEARERLLGRVFRAVEERLAEAACGAAYLRDLPREVATVLSYIEGPAVLHCPPGLEPAVRAAVAALAAPSITVRGDPAAGPGLRAVSAGGGLSVDATLAGRLARRWPGLAIEVLRQAEVAVEEPAAVAAEG
jgi:vacuolar-type H+-ATPase subunit E/Vma4